MVKKEAIDILQHVRRDYDNGVNVGSVGKALLWFAVASVEAYDDCHMTALDQAEWEFQNNPLQPGARIACEKLGKAFEISGEKARKELLADQGLPGIEIESTLPEKS